MLFRSKLCGICQATLRQVFETLGDLASDNVPHHLTKDSLVDSVLHQSCHLCRLIIYHLKLRWSPGHRQGLADLREEPTTLTKKDFEDSDFNFETFSSDRLIVLEYLLELPEDINLAAQIKKYMRVNEETMLLLEFDCEKLGSDKPRFWAFDEKAFGSPPATSRWNENTSATSCQQTVKGWLDECKGHAQCPALKEPFLPTRLLDIGDVETTSQVRLVASQSLDQTSRYVSLSHMWGKEVPFQLRAGTMEDMKAGFQVDKMPKTFRDAIAVARWADVRYIWIDSCCIIQGDPVDWAIEAKTMQKVYANTYFNISADHSMNSHGGCFVDRLAYKIMPCPYLAPNIGQVFLVSRFGLTRPFVESPIASRAWVIQEKFLSPRILHFTEEQVFWECGTLFACETFPLGMPAEYDNSSSRHFRLRLQASGIADIADLHRMWIRICQDYSNTALTYSSDRIIAFAGVVGEFRDRLPSDTYLAGIWKGDLIFGLLWKSRSLEGCPMQPNGSHEKFADPYITADVPSNYRAPSWSWLGKDCWVIWATRERYDNRDMVEILDVSVELVDDHDPAGDMKGGHITLRGYLRAAQWEQEGQYNSVIIDGKSGSQLLSSMDVNYSAKCHFTLQRDTGMKISTRDIFLLPVRMSVPDGAPPRARGTMIFEGLILEPTGKEDEYRRLGYFEAWGEGHCRAVLYEALPAALGFEQPWKSLAPLMAEEMRVAGDGVGGQYDDDFFKEVVKRVMTIV